MLSCFYLILFVSVLSSVEPDGIKPTAGKQVGLKWLSHVIAYSESRHRPRKRTCFTMCTSTVLWNPFFVPVKWLEAPPLAKKPRHLKYATRVLRKAAGEKHQTKACTCAFVCFCAVFFFIKVICSDLKLQNNKSCMFMTQPVFLLVPKNIRHHPHLLYWCSRCV